jgi:type I restriction enzyme S subunit
MNRWPTIALGDICSPKQHPALATSELLEAGFPVFGANGQIGYFNRYTHSAPTIAITCRGATCGTINITPPRSYITGNAMALDALDNSKVDLVFLAYALKTRGLRDVISGSAQPQITRSPLLDVRVPFPPLDEQRRIAAILDQAHDLRCRRQNAIERLNALRKAMFLDTFGDPATNSNNWDKGTVERALTTGLLREIQDGNHGERHPKVSDFLSEGVPFVTANCLVGGKLDVCKAYKLNGSWLRKLRIGFAKPGDMLLSHKGTIGEVAIVPHSCADPILSPQVTYYRPGSGLNVQFLAGYFRTSSMQAILAKEAEQSTRSYIGITRQRALPLFFPPMSLQRQFAERILALEEIEAQNIASASAMNSLFTSLQYRAFGGEL